MRIISFAWTTPALLAGRKTCIRREWDDKYAQGFHEGDLVAAYDKSPRYGGKRVATIRLRDNPYQQSTMKVPFSDWEKEGFAYLAEIGAKVNGKTPHEVWDHWLTHNQMVWVVRFELVRA